MINYRAALTALLLACVSPLFAEILSEGVEYQEYTTGHPNRVYVLKMDRSNPDLMIHMGFPEQRRNFSSRQSVSTIANIYDTPEFDVIGAVNGSFFAPGIQIHDALGSENVAIQGPGGTRETFMLSDARLPRIVQRLRTASQTLRFADGTTMDIDFWNQTRNVNSLALYTPIWGASTRTTYDGVEVVLTGVNHPARGDKWVSGVVSAIRVGSASRNNTIPPDGIVLSARDTKANELLTRIKLGDRLEARIDINHRGVSSAALMITGRGWLLSGGEINESNWSSHPTHRDVRHPRTVVAWNDDSIFLVAIDGRQSRSVGMDFMEMATFLQNTLGATDAVNLDGGGSTTMVTRGTVRNSPSDGSARAVSNALMIVKKTKPFTPVQDNFPATGREAIWDEIFRYNPVVPFASVPDGGDGYVMHLKSGEDIYESASVGNVTDEDYAVEADVYCDYREDLIQGDEVGGIFARDDGSGKWLYKSFGGGNAYVMAYLANNGSVRMGKVINGNFHSLVPSVSITQDGWHRFRIECEGDKIRYFLDGALQGEATDTSFQSGRAGIAVWDTYIDESGHQGIYVDNFRTKPMPDATIAEWALY